MSVIDTVDGIFLGTPGPTHAAEGRRHRLREVVAFDFGDNGEFFGVIVDYATYPDAVTRAPRWVVQPIPGHLEHLASSGKLQLSPGADLAYCYANLRAGRFPNGQVVDIVADNKLRTLTKRFALERADWLAGFSAHDEYRRR